MIIKGPGGKFDMNVYMAARYISSAAGTRRAISWIGSARVLTWGRISEDHGREMARCIPRPAKSSETHSSDASAAATKLVLCACIVVGFLYASADIAGFVV